MSRVYPEPEVDQGGSGDQAKMPELYSASHFPPRSPSQVNVNRFWALKPQESTAPTSAWDFNRLDAEPTNLEQRFALAFERQLGVDVEFEVGTEQEVIRAHKVIMGSASNVFGEMFFEIKPSRRYRFPDCRPDAFLALVQFIYKRQPVSMNIEEVEHYFHVGLKFAVPKFLNCCKDSLISSISTKTVLDIQHIAEKLQLGQTVFRPCMGWIEKQTLEVLQFHFNNLNAANLADILKSNHLEASEVELFEFLIRWAKAECTKRGIVPDRNNLRNVAQQLLCLIRIPKLPSTDFPESLLVAFFTSEEILERSSNLTQTKNQASRQPRMLVKPSSVEAAVVAREIEIHELIYALLPLERRKLFTVERLEKLYKYVRAFLTETSKDSKILVDFLKKVMIEV